MTLKYKILITNRKNEVLREEIFHTQDELFGQIEKLDKIKSPDKYLNYDMNLSAFQNIDPDNDTMIGSVRAIIINPQKKRLTEVSKLYRHINQSSL